MCQHVCFVWCVNETLTVSLQDYRANAEKAKRELDGQMRKGRALKVRFAPHSAAVKVKNLTPWVSNELLEKGFSVFGEVSLIQVISFHCFVFCDIAAAFKEKNCYFLSFKYVTGMLHLAGCL